MLRPEFSTSWSSERKLRAELRALDLEELAVPFIIPCHVKNSLGVYYGMKIQGADGETFFARDYSADFNLIPRRKSTWGGIMGVFSTGVGLRANTEVQSLCQIQCIESFSVKYEKIFEVISRFTPDIIANNSTVFGRNTIRFACILPAEA